MCEYSRRLVAWIDGEIETREAAEIQRHLAACAECRSCVEELRQVSGEFDEYCKEIARAEDARRAIRMRPILWAAAAVFLALIFGYSRRSVLPPPAGQPDLIAKARPDASAPATMKTAASVPAPFRPDHHRAHRPASVPTDKGAGFAAPCASQDCASANTQAITAAEEPAIEIAIPAEAIFPPGAVPEGMSFVADLSIGADGSAKQMRLQPQIAELERRTRR